MSWASSFIKKSVDCEANETSWLLIGSVHNTSLEM